MFDPNGKVSIFVANKLKREEKLINEIIFTEKDC